MNVQLLGLNFFCTCRQQQRARMKQKELESAKATAAPSPSFIYSEYSLVVYHQSSSAMEGGVEISNGWTSDLSEVRDHDLSEVREVRDEGAFRIFDFDSLHDLWVTHSI